MITENGSRGMKLTKHLFPINLLAIIPAVGEKSEEEHLFRVFAIRS